MLGKQVMFVYLQARLWIWFNFGGHIIQSVLYPVDACLLWNLQGAMNSKWKGKKLGKLNMYNTKLLLQKIAAYLMRTMLHILELVSSAQKSKWIKCWKGIVRYFFCFHRITAGGRSAWYRATTHISCVWDVCLFAYEISCMKTGIMKIVELIRQVKYWKYM